MCKRWTERDDFQRHADRHSRFRRRSGYEFFRHLEQRGASRLKWNIVGNLLRLCTSRCDRWNITGSTAPSFTGTHTGQITTWPSGSSPLSFTLTLTQNSDFSISGSGQITGQGLVQTITLPTSPTGSSVYSGVIGATFALQGTWTDATQSQAIQVTGHLNQSGTLAVIVGTGLCGLCTPVWQTGTLTMLYVRLRLYFLFAACADTAFSDIVVSPLDCKLNIVAKSPTEARRCLRNPRVQVLL